MLIKYRMYKYCNSLFYINVGITYTLLKYLLNQRMFLRGRMHNIIHYYQVNYIYLFYYFVTQGKYFIFWIGIVFVRQLSRLSHQ